MFLSNNPYINISLLLQAQRIQLKNLNPFNHSFLFSKTVILCSWFSSLVSCTSSVCLSSARFSVYRFLKASRLSMIIFIVVLSFTIVEFNFNIGVAMDITRPIKTTITLTTSHSVIILPPYAL